MQATIICVAVVLAFCQAARAMSVYDCNRMDDCQNGKPCLSSGMCDCGTEYDGYNCAVALANKVDISLCTPVCQNGGVCQNSADSVYQCICPYGYYGAACNLEPVSIGCTSEQISFTLRLPSAFSGIVELSNTNNVGDCIKSERQGDDYIAYALTVIVGESKGADTCGEDMLLKQETIDFSVYSGMFFIHYNPSIITQHDEQFNLSCIHKSSNVELSKRIGVVNVQIGGDNLIEKNATYNPVQLSILKMDNTDLLTTDELKVGHEFLLQISLKNAKDHSALLIDRCVAKNVKTGSSFKEYQLFKNGCPTKIGKNLVTEQESFAVNTSKGSVAARRIKVKAFKFQDSDNMGLTCTAKLCKATDTAMCSSPANCEDVRLQSDTLHHESNVTGTTAIPSPSRDGNDTTNATSSIEMNTSVSLTRRRRGMAEDNFTDDEHTVSAIIVVRAATEYSRLNTSNGMENTSEKQCFIKTVAISGVTVLGSMLALQLLMSVYIATVIKQRRQTVSADKTQVMPAISYISKDLTHEAYKEI